LCASVFEFLEDSEEIEHFAVFAKDGTTDDPGAGEARSGLEQVEHTVGRWRYSSVVIEEVGR
jgi:hypothetical protein